MPVWEWRKKAFFLSIAQRQEVMKSLNLTIWKGKVNEIQSSVYFEDFFSQIIKSDPIFTSRLEWPEKYQVNCHWLHLHDRKLYK